MSKRTPPGRFSLIVPVQQVIDVMDGDTFRLLAFNVTGSVRIRVLPINTPEIKQPGFQEAKDFLKQWLLSGPFKVDTVMDDSFGRLLANVTRGDENVGELMIEKGLGVRFTK